MPPQISHVILVVNAQGQPYPGLLVAVPLEEAGDDTQYRIGLMAAFAQRCMHGTGIEIKTLSQIWTFWETFALPSGVQFAFLEGAAPMPATAPPPPPPPPPPTDVPEEPPQAQIGDDSETPMAPTHLEPGHA